MEQLGKVGIRCKFAVGTVAEVSGLAAVRCWPKPA